MTTHIKPTLKEIVGGPSRVLTTLFNDPDYAKVANARVAAAMCRDVIETIAKVELRHMIMPVVREAYDMYVLVNGEFDALTVPRERDEWASGIDDAIENAMLPYEKMVTADWFGRHVIDTRLHVPVKPGQGAELDRFVSSFADNAWDMLVKYMDKKPDGKVEMETMSTLEIMAAVGVSQSDIETDAMTTNPQPEQQEEQPVSQEPVPTFAETAQRIREYVELSGIEAAQIPALLDNAVDDDDGLALSGLSMLGCTLPDREPLQMQAMTVGGGQALYDAILKEPVPYEGDAQAFAPVQTAAPAAPVLPPPVAPATPAAPVIQNAGTPAPAKPRGKKASGEPVAGSIPPQAFMLLRDHLKRKDEDVAASIGMSRQTLINYSKPTSKAHFVPDDTQRKALVDMIDNSVTALLEARAQIAVLPAV